mgnify:CR=1 FL=1|jgi:hypothetical protein
MSKYQLSKYEQNKENPFLKEAIEQIQNNVVKKYKNSAGYGEKAVLQAVDPNTGEMLGHTTFIRQIEVDEEKFTKFYLAQFSSFWDLPNSAIKIFSYIMTKLTPKQDIFFFFMDECMEFTGYKSKGAILIGLGSLVEHKIIARGRTDTMYFINPMVAFNGDRVTFAKTYVKKTKSSAAKVDPNQTSILDQIDETASQ